MRRTASTRCTTTRTAVAIGLAALVAVAADAGARSWAEAQVAHSLDAGPFEQVQVGLGGWPFVVQLARGSVPSVDLEATVPFTAMADRLPAGVELSGQDGLLVATRGGSAVVLSVELDGGELVATPVAVSVAGLQLPVDRLGPGPRERLGALLDTRRLPVDLAEGPVDGVHLTAVAVTPTGLVVTAAATDVPFPPRVPPGS